MKSRNQRAKSFFVIVITKQSHICEALVTYENKMCTVSHIILYDSFLNDRTWLNFTGLKFNLTYLH